MRNRWFYVAVLSTLLFVAVAPVLAQSPSNDPTPTIDNEVNRQMLVAADRQANAAELQVWASYAQILGAIASVGIAWLALRLSIKTSERADKIVVAELRPYISAEWKAEPVFAASNPLNIKKWRLRCRLQNNGQTPARRCISGSGDGYFGKQLPADFDFPDSKFSPRRTTNPGPGASFTNDWFFELNELEEVALGNTSLFVWTWLEYSDSFDRTPRYRLEACMRIVIHGDLKSPKDAQFQFQIVSKFNSSDVDCFRPALSWVEQLALLKSGQTQNTVEANE